MILYHGSNIKVTDIDLSKCRPYKDFGQGFYLTNLRDQAVQMANRVVRLYGGSPHVSAFNLDEAVFAAEGIKILKFAKPDNDWALFVLNNRDKKIKNLGSLLCNQDNKYDLVTDPVANDDIVYLFRTFSRGYIDIEALVRGLEYKSLTTQYSFHTKRVLRYLTPLED